MSLNLISSLSLLKSRLEKSQGEPRAKSKKSSAQHVPVSRLDVRRLNSADMFGGITESDLDTSSSDSEDDDSSSGSSRMVLRWSANLLIHFWGGASSISSAGVIAVRGGGRRYGAIDTVRWRRERDSLGIRCKLWRDKEAARRLEALGIFLRYL